MADHLESLPPLTGILTFHCSDNFGAMLQAYGLKRFLREHGVPADIVRYAPFYMTGRHWWAAYRPGKGFRGRLWSVANMGVELVQHLRIRREFAAQRANMARFRREHLIDLRQPLVRTPRGLRRLPYQTYVVGSDQIWNPAITGGLRRVYFGGFESADKRRVVAYAASLGSSALPPEYDGAFAELVRHVDAVSLREKGAIPYVQRLYPGAVTAVVDPVFLLDPECWREVEVLPAEENYILVYGTEPNPRMSAYIRDLSRRTGLPVVELGTIRAAESAWAERTAGPAEFLGYIRRAAYVVTNSFHAAAFSVLFEKRFLAFAHSQVNTRLSDMLRLHGLEDRLCQDGGDIDAPVDWKAVRQRTHAAAGESGAFLLGNLTGETP